MQQHALSAEPPSLIGAAVCNAFVHTYIIADMVSVVMITKT